MRYNMDGFAAKGKAIELEVVDNSSDKCLYIYTLGDANTDTQCVDVRDHADLTLLYETLGNFLNV